MPRRSQFRFFSSLLCNLAAIESHLGAAYSTILIGLRCGREIFAYPKADG